MDKSLLEKWFKILDEIGVNEDGSITRPGYTRTEDKMIEAVINIAKSYNLQSYEDEVGNNFIYNGENEGDYNMIGSHVDSVLQGGKFDGVAGVLGGLLVLKKIQEQNLNIPLKVGIFRMEESSVFGIASVGSRLVTGYLDESSLHKTTNAEGVSLHEIMTQRLYKTNPKRIGNIKQFLELHIEQGRVLESKNLPLGVVNCVAAPVRMWIKFTGNQDHSGATPMDLRKDSLVAAAELIVAVEKFGRDEMAHSGVATTGIVRNTPNVFNVIPGETTLGLDIRGIDETSRTRTVKNIEQKAREITKERGLQCEITHISESKPTKLDENLQKALSDTAVKLNIPYMVMPSGAGHDAMFFTEICPVGMLFIPCKNGVSHNKEEYAKIEDIVTGCEVLLEHLKSTC